MLKPPSLLLVRDCLLAGALLASIAAAAPALAAAATVPDDMAQRMQACVACHGK